MYKIETCFFYVWIKTNCGKFWKRWEYQATLPASWVTYMQVKEQQVEPDMEWFKMDWFKMVQWTGSKLGKEYTKVVYCYLLI